MPKDNKRPPHIEEAIERGDTAYLSRCGRNGAFRTNQIKQAKRQAQVRAERLRQEILQAEEQQRQRTILAAQQAQELATLEAQRRSQEWIILDWWQHHVIPGNHHIIDTDGNDLNHCSLMC